MTIKSLLVSLAAVLAAGPAFAVEPAITTPGPEIGDGLPGLIAVVLLVGGFFVFRELRKRRG
jgi:hypothetical protein